MEPEIPVVPQIDDEAELDALIENDVSKIRAEQPGAANPPEPATDPKGDEGAGDPPAKDPADPQTPADPATPQPDTQPTELKTPVQGKFESDASFAIRQNLFDLVQKKKVAATPEEASAIERQMDEIRQGFKTISKILPTPKDGSAPEVVQPSPAPQDDSIVRTADLPRILEEIRAETEAKVTIDSFFDKHPEFKDPATREVFTDFFDSNYKLDGKDSKGIAQVLELAHAAMFRPNETVQERVLEGAKVAEKVNAMQFPGGTIVQNGLTPEQDQSVKEMVAAGVPEDKARELILED